MSYSQEQQHLQLHQGLQVQHQAQQGVAVAVAPAAAQQQDPVAAHQAAMRVRVRSEADAQIQTLGAVYKAVQEAEGLTQEQKDQIGQQLNNTGSWLNGVDGKFDHEARTLLGTQAAVHGARGAALANQAVQQNTTVHAVRLSPARPILLCCFVIYSFTLFCV